MRDAGWSLERDDVVEEAGELLDIVADFPVGTVLEGRGEMINRVERRPGDGPNDEPGALPGACYSL